MNYYYLFFLILPQLCSPMKRNKTTLSNAIFSSFPALGLMLFLLRNVTKTSQCSFYLMGVHLTAQAPAYQQKGAPMILFSACLLQDFFVSHKKANISQLSQPVPLTRNFCILKKNFSSIKTHTLPLLLDPLICFISHFSLRMDIY